MLSEEQLQTWSEVMAHYEVETNFTFPKPLDSGSTAYIMPESPEVILRKKIQAEAEKKRIRDERQVELQKKETIEKQKQEQERLKKQMTKGDETVEQLQDQLHKVQEATAEKIEKTKKKGEREQQELQIELQKRQKEQEEIQHQLNNLQQQNNQGMDVDASPLTQRIEDQLDQEFPESEDNILATDHSKYLQNAIASVSQLSLDKSNTIDISLSVDEQRKQFVRTLKDELFLSEEATKEMDSIIELLCSPVFMKSMGSGNLLDKMEALEQRIIAREQKLKEPESSDHEEVEEQTTPKQIRSEYRPGDNMSSPTISRQRITDKGIHILI